MDMSEPIKTDKSYLRVGDFSDRELLERCKLEIVGLLNVRPEITVFGRKCHQHRNVGFFSDESVGYKYSNQLSKSKPLTPSLKLLLEIVNNEFKGNFNGILVNEYMDGKDTIGAHSDNENGLGTAGVIGISIGATRKFRIKNKKTKEKTDILMTDGMILQMGGDFQKEFTHEIPREAKVKESRVSFTFRYHLE